MYLCKVIVVALGLQGHNGLTCGRNSTLNIYQQKEYPCNPVLLLWLQGLFFLLFFVDMQLRRKIMNDCKGQPRLQKAVALALFLKFCVGRSSMIRDYSINKIHNITKISATTIKKYLPIIRRIGLISYCGKNNQHIIVHKLCSHTQGRNINITDFCFDSYKDVYNSLRSYLVLIIQSHKDFVKRTIQTFAAPGTTIEFKAARKQVKRLVRQGVLSGVDSAYKEYGLSFKRIAKETGNCVRTAQRIIKYAIAKGWVGKHHNQEIIYLPNICYRYVDGCTFTTKDYIYKVNANTYTLNVCLCL